MRHIFQKVAGAGIGLLALAQALPALAVTYDSTNYKIVDPQVQLGGGSVSSTTYRLIGTIGESAIGSATSTTYILRAGSLTYPRCTEPVLTATPGTSRNTLTWTSATCEGGWTVSSYQYCVGTASDTYSSCTTGTSGTIVTATPGALQYYRVRVIATGAASSGSPAGNVGSRSNEATATAGGGTTGGGGGGGATGAVTQLTVTAPNGGEQLISGTSANIVWTSAGTINTVRIKLSSDGGYNFATTVAASEANDGAYAWTVPVLTGSTFRIMIEGKNATGDVVISDMSNNNFAIGPAGAVPTPVSTPTPTITPTVTVGTPSVVSNVSVMLSGVSFPNGIVTALRDGASVGFVNADANGAWAMTMPNLTPGGVYSFGFYGINSSGTRSVTTTRTVTLPNNSSLYKIENLVVAPTIAVSSTSVQPGADINFNGSSAPGTTLSVEFNDLLKTLAVGSDGLWNLTRNTQGLSGNYSARAKSAFGTEVSGWSELLAFTVGGAAQTPPSTRNADINGDGRINLRDFSRLVAYWLQSSPPTNVDLNSDGAINIRDLSILLYRWTG